MKLWALALSTLLWATLALAQTINPINNWGSPSGPLVPAWQPLSSPPYTLQQRGLNQVFASDYGAPQRSVDRSYTASVVQNQATFTSPPDFQLGQGILFPTLGPTYSLAAPTPVASVVGTTGSTTRNYWVSSLDTAGGYGAAVLATTTTSNATLTAANYVSVAITFTGGTAYAVWGQVGAGAITYLGSGSASPYLDTGNAGANIQRPFWLPAAPPTGPSNDWCIGTITGGVGTSTLAFTGTCPNAPIPGPQQLGQPPQSSGTTVTVRHDDTAALNLALVQPNSQLNLPCSVYGISSPLIFTSASIGTGILGSGLCTQIISIGTLDDFTLLGTAGSPLTANYIDNLYLVDTARKASGFAINGNWTNKLDLSNLYIDHPYSSITLSNFNDVRLAHLRTYRFFGQQGNILALRTDSTHASCCLDGTDVYGTSLGTVGDNSTGQTGYLIDGNVGTVIVRNFDESNISGPGLLVSNVIANAGVPQFLQFSDFGTEFTVGRGVDLESGLDISFSNSFIHAGSDGNFVSCASSANLYVANGVNKWSWTGGRIGNASGNNVTILGQEGKISATSIIWGSATNAGGTNGACPATEFGTTAVSNVLTGSVIGDALHPTWQSQPALLDASSKNNIVCTNAFAGNVSNGITNNGTNNIVASCGNAANP